MTVARSAHVALALALVAVGSAACSSETPTGSKSGTAAGTTKRTTGTTPATAVDPNTPFADPGVGVNPTEVGAAAPPPTTPATEAGVTFADGADMPFVDPTTAEGKAARIFFEGAWSYTGGFLEQAQGARQASLSFREYTGDGLGAGGGNAPNHYRTDVKVWVYQASDQYSDMVGAPLGILGYAPYFIDQTHYMLAVAKPKTLEVWAVDGFQPGTEWPVTNRLAKRDLPTPLDVGTPVAWSVEVDAGAGTAQVWANGEFLASVNHPMLRPDAGQGMALVSNGNYVHFQDLKFFRF